MERNVAYLCLASRKSVQYDIFVADIELCKKRHSTLSRGAPLLDVFRKRSR
jgi:hypothetical protein